VIRAWCADKACDVARNQILPDRVLQRIPQNGVHRVQLCFGVAHGLTTSEEHSHILRSQRLKTPSGKTRLEIQTDKDSYFA
jgi:hypothetical protein